MRPSIFQSYRLGRKLFSQLGFQWWDGSMMQELESACLTIDLCGYYRTFYLVGLHCGVPFIREYFHFSVSVSIFSRHFFTSCLDASSSSWDASTSCWDASTYSVNRYFDSSISLIQSFIPLILPVTVILFLASRCLSKNSSPYLQNIQPDFFGSFFIDIFTLNLESDTWMGAIVL